MLLASHTVESYVAILVGLDLIVNALPYLMPNIVFHKLTCIFQLITLYVRHLNNFLLKLEAPSIEYPVPSPSMIVLTCKLPLSLCASSSFTEIRLLSDIC